jgi:hypothetical protein
VGVFSVVATTTFGPLDSNMKAAHVHIMELVLCFFGISVIIILNKSIGALYRKEVLNTKNEVFRQSDLKTILCR